MHAKSTKRELAEEIQALRNRIILLQALEIAIRENNGRVMLGNYPPDVLEALEALHVDRRKRMLANGGK